MCLFNFFKKKKNKKKVNHSNWNSNDTIWYDYDYNDYDYNKNKEHFIDTIGNNSNNQSDNTSLVEDIYMYNDFL